MMRKLLKGMSCVHNYIDDILVHTGTWKEHLIALRELFSRLEAANLTIKAAKCSFGVTEVDYVGHKITSGKISPQLQNVDKVLKAERPKTKKEVRSFVGLVTYYANHIPNFANVIAPITDLTTKNKPNNVIWESKHEQAFQMLKSMITSEPILQMPNFDKTFILQVDASDSGIGGALMQDYEGELRPVALTSRKLSSREKAFAVIEKECLAVIHSIKKFHVYLFGRQFVIQTDHLPLVCMNQNRVANDRIMRWALLLQPYSMKIEYIKGSQNVFADFLSRFV